MMRGVIVYGALLAVTLGASYYRWTHEPDKALEGKVVVLQGEPDTLDRITWKGKDDEAVIEKKKDDKGDYYWVTYTKWEKKKPEQPDAKADSAGQRQRIGAEVAARKRKRKRRRATAPEEKEAVVSNFKSGKAATELAAACLASSRAQARGRHARQAQDDRDGDPVEHVILDRNGKTTDIELGGESYGTKDRYARIAGTSDIYLIDDEVIRSLKFARTRLPDRDLFPFETPKIETAVVGDGTSSITAHAEEPRRQGQGDVGPGRRARRHVRPVQDVDGQVPQGQGSSYVNDADVPKDLELRFQVTLTGEAAARRPSRSTRPATQAIGTRRAATRAAT
jgi:hypothetical protein